MPQGYRGGPEQRGEQREEDRVRYPLSPGPPSIPSWQGRLGLCFGLRLHASGDACQDGPSSRRGVPQVYGTPPGNAIASKYSQ